jgi:hypothetical protein
MLQKSQELVEREDSLSVEPPEFTPIDAYTTFFCEYTFKGTDVHFHFFRSPETATFPEHYWKNFFPVQLDQVARAHFGYEYPRLQASLVDGVLRAGKETGEPESSWWMICQQLDVPDPEAKISKFFELLDQALEKAIKTQ